MLKSNKIVLVSAQIIVQHILCLTFFGTKFLSLASNLFSIKKLRSAAAFVGWHVASLTQAIYSRSNFLTTHFSNIHHYIFSKKSSYAITVDVNDFHINYRFLRFSHKNTHFSTLFADMNYH